MKKKYMKNCNWKTKLKKNFYQKNKKLKEWRLKIKIKQQKGQWCILAVSREKKTKINNHWWQSDHYTPTRATRCKRKDGCAFSKMMDD